MGTEPVLSPSRLDKTQSFNSQVNIINRIVRRENCGAERRKGDTHKIDSGNDKRRFAVGRHPHQSAAAVQAGCDADVSLLGECQALRSTEAAIPWARFAVRIDGPDGVI